MSAEPKKKQIQDAFKTYYESGKKNLSRNLRQLGDFILITAKHFDSDHCYILASSIVYTTLISMVPFLTFIMSILSAFQAFDAAIFYFRDLFIEQFGTVVGIELASMLEGFISNAGGLGTVGLISFLVTSVILINRVWITINQIYRTPMHRNRVARFVRFITILIIGTLLLGAYFSVNSILSKWFLEILGVNLLSLWFLRGVSVFGPWIVIWLVIFLLIFFVPTTRVKFRSAFLGSVCGMVAFQIANKIFSKVVIRFINYSVIYGSLASILVMLFWIFFLWVIIFGAVEIAYVHQYLPDIKKKRGLKDSPALELANGIDIILLISEHFKDGYGSIPTKEIAKLLRIPDSTLYTYLELYEKAGLILPVDRMGRSYIPAKPLDSVKMTEILDLLFGGIDEVNKDISLSAGDRTIRYLFRRGTADITDMKLGDLYSGSNNQDSLS